MRCGSRTPRTRRASETTSPLALPLRVGEQGYRVMAPRVATPDEVATRMRGTPRVVMLDVDGTLAPIAARPDAAVVPARTRRTLTALAARPGTQVVIVSGRSAEDARRMVQLPTAWFIGNHGIQTVAPTGETTVEPAVQSHRPAMARFAETMRRQVAHMNGVIVEDKEWTLTVHYRLAGDGVLAELRPLVESAARAEGLRTVKAKKAIEVRPPVDIDKGTAVLALAQRLGGLSPGASLLFAGDDVTDEDAFRALRDRASTVVTIRVAGGDGEGASTHAELRVANPEALRVLLEAVARGEP